MGIEQHGRQHYGVAEEDGQHRLFPVHAALDQAGRQHVRQDVDRHRDPQRGVVVSAPGPASGIRGSKVPVIERTAFDVAVPDLALSRDGAHGVDQDYLAAATTGCCTALKASSMMWIASSTSLLAIFSGGDMRTTLP